MTKTNIFENTLTHYAGDKVLAMSLIEAGNSVLAVANLILTTGMTEEEALPILRKIVAKLKLSPVSPVV